MTMLVAAVPAVALYLGWTAATWFLEGRIHTLLRPEAVAARIAYVLVANMLVGTLGAFWVLRRARGTGLFQPGRTGIAPPRRMLFTVPAGAGLGLAVLLPQVLPSRDPLVLFNAFCQTLTVSIPEVLVCWAVVGATAEALSRRTGRFGGLIGGLIAAAIASALFGAYHVAHSPPFDSMAMIVLLSEVGLATSLVFLLGRDIYGTILFHNAMAMFGVVQALAAAGGLAAYAAPRPPLYAMAAASVLLLLACDVGWLRRRATPSTA